MFFLSFFFVLMKAKIEQDGEKPCQIISAQLAIGYQVKQDASNGDTNVVINNRVITKTEQWMLQVDF